MFLVLGLLAVLLGYVIWGVKSVNSVNFSPFFSKGFGSVFATASFVFISYGGLTKVAALAEETKNPGKNLPLGMILSLIVTSIFYSLVIFVTIGVLSPENLKGTLTPISDGAGVFGGDVWRIIISIGAFLAFISTANAGIMTASRYPLGMSRDKLLPAVFQKISSKFRTPYIAIFFTGAFMIFAILFFKLELLVKIASSILILLYILANLTVILFRESKILSYRPKFHAPFYPYLQSLGILGGGFLLIEMGTFILFLTMIFLLIGIIWYKVYVQKRAVQDSALIHVLEKLIVKDKELVSDNLLTELKDIVIKREGIFEQKFYKLVEQAKVLDIDNPLKMEDFFNEVSNVLSKSLKLKPEELLNKFMEKEKESSTVIAKGLAIPHIFIERKNANMLVLVRARSGIIFPEDQLVHIAFILVGSSGERVLHLKILAAIATIVQSHDFEKKWLEAQDEEELRYVILLTERERG